MKERTDGRCPEHPNRHRGVRKSSAAARLGSDESTGSAGRGPQAAPLKGFDTTDTLRAEDYEAYGGLMLNLRRFLDAIAAAAPRPSAIGNLTNDLSEWTRRLVAVRVPETGQIFGRVDSLPARGQAFAPEFRPVIATFERVEGTTSFGRWMMGSGGSAHGGAIALLFDEVLGLIASSGPAGRTRTASLTVDFRSLTPIDTTLDVAAWVTREEGRKRFLHAEIRHGGVLCAEADGLFIVVSQQS
jgi:acyl-coenzyme A thioesterase PaaI-like protein